MDAPTTQLEQQRPGPQITVHEYQSSSLLTRISEPNLLRQGHHIVNAVRDPLWKSAQGFLTKSILRTGTAYVFNKNPPSINPTSPVCHELKEWGTAVSEDEVYTLDDLEEFNASEFSNALMEHTSAERTPSATPAPTIVMTRRKRVRDESLSVGPESKRRKLGVGSLFRVIPQPHMHPSMFDIQERTFKKAFTNRRPQFVLPYTKDTFPNNSRLGWLIPIRGSFPWEGCTPGEMLDTSHAPSADESRNIDHISWSEDSLLKFWNYLLELRKLGKLGTLAISFHPSREPKQSSHSTRAGLPSDTSKFIRPTEPTSALSKIDYFKVYHDAPNAMYVRTALDLFAYPRTVEDGRTERIRMLKGVRLALVNEASQGILVI